MHTRFEHSLGVMHTATLLYQSIVNHSHEILDREHVYNKQGLERDEVVVRLAALLHDVGHGPFSHAGEELLPPREASLGPYTLEHYSAAIVRRHIKDVI